MITMSSTTRDVMQCSFANWYKTFEDVTVESIIIPLPESFLSYLHTDGLVLPEESNHGLYTKSTATAMDGDDDDPDIRDEDLMNMYEADWSTPAKSNDVKEMPEFGKFDTEVKEAIKHLGGRVFPKLNWSSPKDATWISFDRSLLCTCPSDVYLLLKSSEFISHDLDQPFLHCKDSEMPQERVSYVLVLRRWQPPDPGHEFRVFVKDQNVLGICQRQSTKYYSHIVTKKEDICVDINQFHKNKIKQKFCSLSYVFDVERKAKGDVRLVDFNPWSPVTDSLMFTWDELQGWPPGEGEECTFRCVESEAGVRATDYASSAFPRDVQELSRGEDPAKLMDLLNLKTTKDGQWLTCGSSDEEDDGKKTAGD